MKDSNKPTANSKNVKHVEAESPSPDERFKLGVRYLHPKYREITLISRVYAANGTPRDLYYAARNSGERVDVPISEIGEESPNQEKPCLGCGLLTKPMGFYPHRRKCWFCVKDERDVRRGYRSMIPHYVAWKKAQEAA